MKEDKKRKQTAWMEEEHDRMRKEEERRKSANEKKDLEFEKSRTAYEKLQLAWVKANITFIGLGFVAYKFYQSRVDHGQHPLGHLFTGRHLGILLILIGTIVLSLTTWQHFNRLAQLKTKYGRLYYSVALLLSYIVLGLDLVLLLMIIFRL